jgi:hypothetical protein
MVTEKELIDKYTKTRHPQAFNIDASTGVWQESTQYKLVQFDDNKTDYFGFEQNAALGKRKIIGKLTASDVAVSMSLIDSLRIQNYGDVISDRRWRQIYRYEWAAIPHIDHNGKAVTRYFDSFPCHYCGIILPDFLVQVDHRQPQARPGLAVVKCARAADSHFTESPSVGTKALQIDTISKANSIKKVSSLKQSSPEVSGKWLTFDWEKTPSANKISRYTLTDEGKTFVSVMSMFWGQAYVESYCLDNIINLVPSCSRCNSSKNGRAHARYVSC